MKKFNTKKALRKLNFKRKKNKYMKYTVIVICLCLTLVGGIYFSKSKYSSSGIIQIINSKVSPFTAKDYIIGSYINGEESLDIPAKDSGYSFDHIECDSDTKTTWDNYEWKLILADATKRTKCTLYFVTKTSTRLNETIINAAGGVDVIKAKGTPDFSTTSTTDEGIYMAEDDYGTSYYFRGAVTNNNLIFGGFCWKIIRINGDNSTRIIYNGISNNNQCTSQAGEDTNIGTGSYNTNYNNNSYVGYMYGYSTAEDYTSSHTNLNNSTIKTYIDKWYSANLENYNSYISDTLFCNDRSVASSSGLWNELDTALGYGINRTYYGYYSRHKSTPSLKCINKNDRFTVSDTTTGNGAMAKPVSLISADEVSFAGGTINSKNNLYYLYNNEDYWVLSPSYFDSYYKMAYNCYMDYNGSILIYSTSGVFDHKGIRPVISLKYDIEVIGEGTPSNPYKVV